jgi:hypothetical protein
MGHHTMQKTSMCEDSVTNMKACEHSKISGSHSDKYVDGSLLGCCTIVLDRLTNISEKLIAPINQASIIIIALLTEEVSSSEISIIIYKTTRHEIPEESHLCTIVNITLSFLMVMKNCQT